MKFYIIDPTDNKPGNYDYKIVQVQEADEAAFLAEHGHQVLVCGGSIHEILISFGKLKDSQAAGG